MVRSFFRQCTANRNGHPILILQPSGIGHHQLEHQVLRSVLDFGGGEGRHDRWHFDHGAYLCYFS